MKPQPTYKKFASRLPSFLLALGLASSCGGGGSATPPPPAELGALGDACGSGDECDSGFCVDDVCCDTACDGACGSCLAADTGGTDGTCGPLPADTACREADGTCDVAEACNGTALNCPSNAFAPSTSPLCAPFTCPGNAGACETTCASSADCAPGAMCNQAACVVAKRMFITSTTTTGNIVSGGLTGLAAADAICNDLATAANITGTYKAWLSTSATSAASRMAHFNGPYYRLNEGAPLLVANNWDDLVDSITVAIATDENGTIRGNEHVYTGTSGNGSSVTVDCLGWTSASQAEVGYCGFSSSGDTSWTANSNQSCIGARRFYCVEQ